MPLRPIWSKLPQDLPNSTLLQPDETTYNREFPNPAEPAKEPTPETTEEEETEDASTEAVLHQEELKSGMEPIIEELP